MGENGKNRKQAEGEGKRQRQRQRRKRMMENSSLDAWVKMSALLVTRLSRMRNAAREVPLVWAVLLSRQVAANNSQEEKEQSVPAGTVVGRVGKCRVGMSVWVCLHNQIGEGFSLARRPQRRKTVIKPSLASSSIMKSHGLSMIKMCLKDQSAPSLASQKTM